MLYLLFLTTPLICLFALNILFSYISLFISQLKYFGTMKGINVKEMKIAGSCLSVACHFCWSLKHVHFPLCFIFLFSFTLVSVFCRHYPSNICGKRQDYHRLLPFYKNERIIAHWEISSNLKLLVVILVYIISYSSITLLKKK